MANVLELEVRAWGRVIVLSAAFGLASWSAAYGREPGSSLRVLNTRAAQYEMVELALQAESVPDNPFDPNRASIDATVTFPSGGQVKVPGFWFQDYRREIRMEGAVPLEALSPSGAPEWRIRFSSAEVGRHEVRVEVRDRGRVVRSESGSFEVTAGSDPGFVRVSPRNPRYLETDQGQAFFEIGQNLCMYETKEGTAYYDRLLPKLRNAGGNYVRLWQEYYVPREHLRPAGAGSSGFTGFPLETQLTGLGRYDLESAWRLDYVAGLCEELDVYWQLASEMVVWWQTGQAHRWTRNPYNAANGGPCEKPSDYLVNPVARELVKRRLRYNVARWGWTTHLVAWELWNEVDNLEGFTSEANTDWHREMAGYLKSIDPWRHLVTTSWRDPGRFSVPDIDIVQGHSYFPPEIDAARYSIEDTDHLMRNYGKPFFFGEQGIEGPVSVDPEGKHFHDCLWATILSGATGTGMYWWWHNYIDDYDLYRHYRAIAAFVKDVDWPSREWKDVRLSRPTLPVTLDVYGLAAPDRALVWVHDTLAFRIAEGKATKGPEQLDSSLNLVGLDDGDYSIEWWDTTSGTVVKTEEGDVRKSRHYGYGLELKPPPFWGDIAARVIRKGQSW